MPHSDNLSYAFGPFQFNPTERVLTRDGETISLRPKAAEVLIKLVMNAGQLVAKDELLREVWPETFVEEANLTQNIFTLRRALGDDRAGPRYIETVVRRGYRFIAAVKVISVNGRNGDPLAAVGAAATQRPVIAVLPFLNDTGDSELEYLADGVTDNIINNLSRVSKLRVMSHSAAFRYKTKDVDPQHAGRELGAHAVLVGKIDSRPAGIAIAVELVDPSTGWQLWGEVFDSESTDILEIQDAITRQILSTLKLKLTGEEEKRVTARYTENAAAYQSYLEGRFHWSRYTRRGIEKAITHFRQAIELDPNYALAYAAIVDCYLRLATDYLPPEDDLGTRTTEMAYQPEPGSEAPDESDPRVKLRFEWDWKGAERELRRANELKTDYPSAHQWYAAYRFMVRQFGETFEATGSSLHTFIRDYVQPRQFFSATLSPNEQAQVFCAITREQVEVGNYDAGCLMLGEWWKPGNWPNLQGLSSHAAADLLFTVGSLVGCLSSTGRIQKGQKHAEDLLSGSVGIFEHLGAKRRSAEGRIELALSYYRQGMFDLSRTTLLRVLSELQPGDNELSSLALIRLGVVERHSGHVADSFSRFSEALSAVEESGPLVTGRYYHELATTLQEIAIAESRPDYIETVTRYFQRAFYEFVAIGHHRYAAVVENNHGLLLLSLDRFNEAEAHLVHARRLFEGFDDRIRGAQVDDTLARLYVATARLNLADFASQRAVASLEANDEDALLAEALTTRAIVFCKLNRYSEARAILEGARRIAERCGDSEGAGRALLVLIEEMYTTLNETERQEIANRVRALLQNTQVATTRCRLENCLRLISN
jgi:TolB-like protein